MSRRPYNDVVRDQFGNVLPGTTVTVAVHDTGLPATFYAAEVGGVALSTVTAGTDGSVSFWVDDADYAMDQTFDLSASLAGYSTKQKIILL
jgi:hypothetical protein